MLLPGEKGGKGGEGERSDIRVVAPLTPDLVCGSPLRWQAVNLASVSHLQSRPTADPPYLSTYLPAYIAAVSPHAHVHTRGLDTYVDYQGNPSMTVHL